MTREAKHTLGPWRTKPCSNGGLILLRGPDGVENRHIQSHVQILPEEDARLIAAAPEMYEALRELYRVFVIGETGAILSSAEMADRKNAKKRVREVLAQVERAKRAEKEE